ncbi:glycosyltransferase [Algibacter lectus]|nr:glycosyltransferase [Algibacter lectus]
MNNAVDARSFTFDPDLSDNIRKELDVENKHVLGHVGRFTQQKNHAYLIHIYAEVLKRNSNCVLLLIGTGPLENEIKLLSKQLGVKQQIKFLGMRTNIAELLQAIDVFIFPSFFEGLPVTLIESQAAGLKILASDTITDEVKLTNDISYLSINESPEIWANKIISVLPVKKKNNFDLIVENNYDIISNALEIETFYLQQSK